MVNKSNFLLCRLVTYCRHVLTYRKHDPWLIPLWNFNIFIFPFPLNVEGKWIKCLHINDLDSTSGGSSYVNFHQQIEIASRPHSASNKKRTISCYFSSRNRIVLWTLLSHAFIANLYRLLWNRSWSFACIISSNIPLPLFSVSMPFFAAELQIELAVCRVSVCLFHLGV
jgi:hypothetical protein